MPPHHPPPGDGRTSTCNGAATDQVCEGHENFRGAPEVGVQQGPCSLPQLVQQRGIGLVQQPVLGQLREEPDCALKTNVH